jgi:hypothetical protein
MKFVKLFATKIRLWLTVSLVVSISFVYGQTTPSDAQSKTKFADKIGHWLYAYGMSSPDFLPEDRAAFKEKAFAEVYVEATINYDAWMFNLLNKVTQFRYPAKQMPHIIFEVKFTPTDATLTAYNIGFAIQATSEVSVNLQNIANEAAADLSGKTYTEPAKAVEDIEKAIKAALNTLADKLGDELAPNLLVRYANEVFWNGHEIGVMEGEGNYVELEAVDKTGAPINPSQLTWTNADPFESKGVVDMTGVNTKEVTLVKTGEERNPLRVMVKRVGTSEDINELLKMLIVEVLSAKKQQARDTIVLLKQDSVHNLDSLSMQIALLESNNLEMEDTGMAFQSLYEEPEYFPDSTNFFSSDRQKVEGFKLLKKRKKIQRTIRRKINVVAFADLVVDKPEMVKVLLDELLRNSGRLIARIILNRDSKGQRDEARNIVIDFLNKNLERIAGNQYPESLGIAQALPPVVIRTQLPKYQPGMLYHISSRVNFPGRAAFEDSLKIHLAKLDTPIFVTVNYSQDVNPGSFIARNKGTRPKGLPPGHKYVTFTLVNIPGSVKYALEIDAGNFGKVTSKSDDIGSTMLQPLSGTSIMQIASFTSDDGKTSYSLEGTRSFMTPSGNIITIDNLSSVGFVTSFPGKIPAGALTRFQLNSSETYFATYTDNFTKFAGYVKQDKTPYAVRNLANQPEIYLGYPTGDCKINIYTVASSAVKSTGVNTIQTVIDYPAKQAAGYAEDTDACLKGTEAKYYYNQCISASTSTGNATTADCYLTARQIDRFSPELLTAYRDVHNAQNNLYTQSAVSSLGIALEAFLTEYNSAVVSVRNSEDPKIIIPLLRTWAESKFATLSAQDRLHIAKVLAKGNLTDINNPFTVFTSNDGGENVMAKLLSSAPTSQAEDLIKGFSLNADENSTSLFFLLKHKMDDVVIGDDNYQKYVFELVRLYYYSSFYKPFDNKNITIENAYLFNGMGLWDGHNYIINEPDGKKVDYNCVMNLDGGLKYGEWFMSPFSTIKVISKVQLPLMTEKFGDRHYIVNVPAFYLRYIFDKKGNANAVEFSLVSVAILANAYTMGIGGTLMASTDKVLWTIGLLDVIAGMTATAIIPAKPLVEAKYGKDSGPYKCVDVLDKILLAYGGARLVTDLLVLPNLHKEAAELWQAEKALMKKDGIVTAQQYDDIERLIANESRVVALVATELKAAQVTDDVLTLGDDLLENAAGWLDKSDGDEYVDILIHAKNNETFSVLTKDGDIDLTVNALAERLRGIDNAKTLRLISCNGSESAKELSQILGRDVVGSEGVLKLYDNGFIETGNWYRARPNGTLDAAPGIPLNNPSAGPTSRFVVLGRAALNTALKSVYGITDDLALKLSQLSGAENLLDNPNLINKINNLGNNKVEFLTDLTSTQQYFVPSIAQRVAELDDEIVDVWLVMRQNADGWPRKRLSYDYLYERKGWTKAQIEDDLRAVSSRDALATAIEIACPGCATAIREANKLNAAVRKFIIPKIKSGEVASNGVKWADLYLKFIDQPTRLKYINSITKEFDWDLFFTLEKYQAHHYFPVNLFNDDLGAFRFMFENMPANRLEELTSFFNSNLNGVLVLNKRTYNGVEYVIHTNHMAYETKIAAFLKSKMKYYKETKGYTTDEVADALFDDVLRLRSSLESKVIESSLLGHTNIDDLDLTDVLK